MMQGNNTINAIMPYIQDIGGKKMPLYEILSHIYIIW